MDHGIEHLGRHDHRLAGQAAGPDDPLLQARHLLGRHLDAEIAARHHDGIRQLDDVVETGHRHRFLQLGQDGNSAVDKVADGGDVVRLLDEGQPHPVRPVVEGEFEVPAVLFRQRRDRQHDVRNVHPLVVRDLTAGYDLGVGEILAAFLDLEPHLAVIDQQLLFRLDRGEHFRMGQRRAARVAGLGRQIEAVPCPLLEADRAVPDLAEAQFRPLKVHQQADRTVAFLFQRPDGLDGLGVGLVVAVAEVEAKDIGAVLKQLLDGLRVRGRRSQGDDDLGVSVAAHRRTLLLVNDGCQ